jgi:hypothetical protein
MNYKFYTTVQKILDRKYWQEENMFQDCALNRIKKKGSYIVILSNRPAVADDTIFASRK